jgi:hypothetical protein
MSRRREGNLEREEKCKFGTEKNAGGGKHRSSRIKWLLAAADVGLGSRDSHNAGEKIENAGMQRSGRK